MSFLNLSQRFIIQKNNYKERLDMKIKIYHENMDNFFSYGYDKLFGVDINKHVYGESSDDIYASMFIRPISTVTEDVKKKVLVKNRKITD